MELTANGTTLIKAFESCLKPIGGLMYRTYYCPAKVLTIGWGSTRDDAPDLKDGDVWPLSKCDAVFGASLGKYLKPIERMDRERIDRGLKPLNANQIDALGSLSYNCGTGVFSGNIGRAVVEGRDDEVPKFMARWNKGGGVVLAGLVRRRKAEGLLYSGDVGGAGRVAETVLPGTVARTREAPAPTTGELVRETKGTAATAVAGTAVAASPAASVDHGIPAGVVIGVGLFVVLVAVVAISSQWKSLKENWA